MSVDSVVLAETDTSFVGKPAMFFGLGPDGSFLIPDQTSDRLMVYDRDGRLRQFVGRRGQGPGEMSTVGITTFVVDSLLIHATMGRSIHMFAWPTGRWVRTLHVRGFVTSAAALGGRLFFGDYDPFVRRGVVVLEREALVTEDTAQVGASLVEFPRDYVTYPDFDMFNSVLIAAWPDTLAVGFGGTDFLVLYDLRGAPTDTLWIPPVRRRGIPEAAKRLFRPNAGSFPDRLAAVSGLYGLWRPDEGGLLAWYGDGETHGVPGQPMEVLNQAWLSLIDPGLRRACVDIRVPAFDTKIPRLAFRHDTLYALDQVVPDQEGKSPRTVIRRFVIDRSRCDWQPVKVAHASPRP